MKQKRTGRGATRSCTSGSARYAATTAGSREIHSGFRPLPTARSRRQRPQHREQRLLAGVHAGVERRRREHERIDRPRPGARRGRRDSSTKRAATRPPRLWPSSTSGPCGSRRRGVEHACQVGEQRIALPDAPARAGARAVPALIVSDDAPAPVVQVPHHVRIAADALAEAVDDDHGAARCGRRPAPQGQREAVVGGQGLVHARSVGTRQRSGRVARGGCAATSWRRREARSAGGKRKRR